MYTDMQSISVVLKINPFQILFHSWFSSAIPPSPLPSFIPSLFHLFPASSFPFLFLTLFHSFPPSSLSSFISSRNLFLPSISSLVHPSSPYSLLLSPLPPRTLSCSEILNQRRCLVWQGVRRSSPRPRTPDTATALN